MSGFTFRPAVREDTPLIIGIAGPTKSGKTMSALRLAVGLANGGAIAMLNAEGPRGHQYAEKFKYLTVDLAPPFRPTAYTEAMKAAAQIKPAVVIVDSASHMHDGPGGIIEWHEEIVGRMAGTDRDKRERVTFAAWVEPKAAENAFIYQMLSMKCPVILCFRAKEKIKISKGKVEELGWQPIAGERVAFETIFTLMLPPHSKGVPDLNISEMREPFEAMVPLAKQIDEELGRRLATWARGSAARTKAHEADGGATEQAQGPAGAGVQAAVPSEQTRGAGPATVEAGAPKEPSKAGDEPARGLFDQEAKPAAPTKPGRTKIPGMDVDDESQALEKAIEAEKANLERQPNEEQWKRICKAIAGTEILDLADPAALRDLLELVQKLVVKDPAAIAKARAILQAPATSPAA